MRKRDVYFSAALLCTLCGCDEKPSAVTRDQLAFLRNQQAPLMLTEVIKRCGQTPPGPEPYFGYLLADKTSVNFWMHQLSEKDEDEISIVVETSPGGKPRIIWPYHLVGSTPYAVLKATWPKMYQ